MALDLPLYFHPILLIDIKKTQNSALFEFKKEI